MSIKDLRWYLVGNGRPSVGSYRPRTRQRMSWSMKKRSPGVAHHHHYLTDTAQQAIVFNDTVLWFPSRPWRQYAHRSLRLFADNDRTLGVMQYVVTDAARKCSTQSAETTWPDHNQSNLLFLCNRDHHLTRLTVLGSDLSRQGCNL